MSPYITSYLRYEESDSSLKYSESTWIYTSAVMLQGLLMPFGGVIQRKIGSRWTSLLGGLIASLGVFMTHFAIRKSFGVVVFTYGILFGFGVGIAYATPINAAMKWYPTHKGLITGIIVAGFGAGAFIFDQVQTAFINPDNLKANVTVHIGQKDEKFFSQHELLTNVPNVFILLGCVYGGMTIVGSLLLIENRQVSTYTALEEDRSECNSDCSRVRGMIEHPRDVLKTRHFWTLWFMFLVNGQAVQFTSILYKTYGQTFISNDHFLAVVGAFASTFNGFGRILWGYLADRIGFRLTMIIQCVIMASLFMTFTLTEKAGEWMYFLWVCLMFGTFCGNFSLFPTATVKTFGQKYFTVNYGMVFSSQIFSGAIASLLAVTISDKLGWFGLFSLVAAFSLLGLILAISYNAKRPDGKGV